MNLSTRPSLRRGFGAAALLALALPSLVSCSGGGGGGSGAVVSLAGEYRLLRWNDLSCDLNRVDVVGLTISAPVNGAHELAIEVEDGQTLTLSGRVENGALVVGGSGDLNGVQIDVQESPWTILNGYLEGEMTSTVTDFSNGDTCTSTSFVEVFPEGGFISAFSSRHLLHLLPNTSNPLGAEEAEVVVAEFLPRPDGSLRVLLTIDFETLSAPAIPLVFSGTALSNGRIAILGSDTLDGEQVAVEGELMYQSSTGLTAGTLHVEVKGSEAWGANFDVIGRRIEGAPEGRWNALLSFLDRAEAQSAGLGFPIEIRRVSGSEVELDLFLGTVGDVFLDVPGRDQAVTLRGTFEPETGELVLHTGQVDTFEQADEDGDWTMLTFELDQEHTLSAFTSTNPDGLTDRDLVLDIGGLLDFYVDGTGFHTSIYMTLDDGNGFGSVANHRGMWFFYQNGVRELFYHVKLAPLADHAFTAGNRGDENFAVIFEFGIEHYLYFGTVQYEGGEILLHIDDVDEETGLFLQTGDNPLRLTVEDERIYSIEGEVQLNGELYTVASE